MLYPKEIQCPDCGKNRQVDYRVVWAIKRGQRTAKCLKCSRFKKGQTNSGGFKKGISPWNKGKFTVICRICGKRLKNSRRCRDCWIEEKRIKNLRPCLLCSKEFSTYERKGKFCSRECFKRSRVWVKIGDKHPNWKGGPPICDCGNLMSWGSVRCRPCQDKYKVGSKHHSWQGGLTSISKRIRSSKRYKNWRNAVFKRDDWTCQICSKRGGHLHADHIKRFLLYPKLRFKISNGRTLCVPCHLKTDTWGSRGLKSRKYKLKKLTK